MKSIKKIISEEFIKLLENNSLENNFSDVLKSKFEFLKDFILFDEKNENDKHVWRFLFKTTNYKIIFRLIKQNDKWSAKYNVYWKKHTKDTTHGAGKDCEFNFGQYKSISNLAKEVDQKIHNSPNMGSHLYEDDYDLAMDVQIVDFLKELKKLGAELENFDDVFFDDLKDIYKQIKDISDDKLLSFSKKKFKNTAIKQDALLDLQKLQRLPYYASMKHVYAKH